MLMVLYFFDAIHDSIMRIFYFLILEEYGYLMVCSFLYNLALHTFIPRKNCPTSIWLRMVLTQIINLDIQRFSPQHTHQYQYLIGIMIWYDNFYWDQMHG